MKHNQLQRLVTPVVLLDILGKSIHITSLPHFTYKDASSIVNCARNTCLTALYFNISSALTLVMASKYHDDWQSSKKTVLQRNAYMFNNELMSNVSFTCGESSRIFHAHKYVLATSSAVFYAMFYGNLGQQESTIRIEDAEEKSFEEFLRYLYTDNCKITAENAIGVMYLAKKYLIWSLAAKCRKVLKANINPDNVFAVLEQAVQCDETELEVKCQVYISEKTNDCINSETFCNIGSHTMNALLKKEILAITELELFNAVLKWVDSECARQGMNIQEDKAARRRVLGDSVYEIRFLAMSQEDFAKYVTTTGILTDAEIVPIFQTFNKLDVTGLKWKREKRHEASFSRFFSVNTTFKWGYYFGDCDALTLTVNKVAFFHGVRLFGSPDGQYAVKFTIKNETVTGTFTSQEDDDKVWGYDVMLPKPVSLLKNEKFTIKAAIKGPKSQNGQNGKSSVKVDDIVLTFENAPPGLSTNATDKNRGQFYKIYLSKQ